MQPLAGIKIVTVAFNMPGPAAVSQLHRWGAEIVKVEPPGGDPLGRNCPELYRSLVGNQQVCELNLKQPADRGQLDIHLAAADLLITSTLPASLARLGLAWNDLHARFPRLCQAIVGHARPTRS
jgi:crotonobetainyl-CoA:carnitine CoA-transferase CaiB-like acyl-CoA transferase